jgi:cytochrome P450
MRGAFMTRVAAFLALWRCQDHPVPGAARRSYGRAGAAASAELAANACENSQTARATVRRMGEALPWVDPDAATIEELAAIRERSWAARSARGLEVLRYDEGIALLRDRRFLKGATFRRRLDNLGLIDGPIREAYDRMLVSNDGEQRTHLRAPHTRLLGPRRALLHAETTRRIVDGVLDELPTDAEVDLLQEIAWKLPPRMYCTLVSAPLELAPVAARLSDSSLAPILTVDHGRRQEAIDAYCEAIEFVRSNVDRRRGDLGDDFTSALIREQEEGNLTEEEMLQTGVSLLQASIDNTVHQIALVLGTLLEEPERWRRIVAVPALIPRAIEEVIRLRPRFGTIFRVAGSDLTFRDLEVAEGTELYVSVRAGQRDPSAFEEPDSFVLDREPKPPLMFGHGAYNCLGQHLARLEISTLLEALVARFPQLHLTAPWSLEEFNAVTEVQMLRGSAAITA